MGPVSKTRWDELWPQLGCRPPSAEYYVELVDCYREAGRAYHNLLHLSACLRHFDAVASQLAAPAEIELALWCHDVIYDPRRQDNEAASAAWASDLLTAAHAAPPLITRISDLILLTRHHEPSIDGDAALLLDIDLAILGAPQPRFDEYERQIRQEYHWVPWPTYCTRRRAVLQAFLDRPTLYQTAIFQGQFESAARANLARSLQMLAQSV